MPGQVCSCINSYRLFFSQRLAEKVQLEWCGSNTSPDMNQLRTEAIMVFIFFGIIVDHRILGTHTRSSVTHCSIYTSSNPSVNCCSHLSTKTGADLFSLPETQQLRVFPHRKTLGYNHEPVPQDGQMDVPCKPTRSRCCSFCCCFFACKLF